MSATNTTLSARQLRAMVPAMVIGLAVLALGMIGPAAANASIGPKVVKATKNNGIKSIGNLKIAGVGRPLTLADVKAKVGPPKKLNRKTCGADYGAGLTLTFVSFGGETNCDDLYLQVGEIKGKKWRVKVGGKVYRKGMRSSRIPQGSKRYPGYGYQVASMPFIGGRTGSVFAKSGSQGKISTIFLFIGGAGD